jgi:X-linked retinitis pigmentosa GTPase regulator
MDRDKYEEERNSNSYTEVYVWGGNTNPNFPNLLGDHYGQLGLGQKYTGKTYPDPKICSFNLVIREVSCGEEHAAFITCIILSILAYH